MDGTGVRVGRSREEGREENFDWNIKSNKKYKEQQQKYQEEHEMTGWVCNMLLPISYFPPQWPFHYCFFFYIATCHTLKPWTCQQHTELKEEVFFPC